MRKLIIGCVAVCLAMGASVASAQTRPNQPSNGRGRNPRQFQQNVLAWTEQMMPNLYQLASPPQGQSSGGYFNEASNHYRIYQNTPEKNRDKLKETYKREDQIFGYVLQLRQAVDNDKPAIREEIYKETLVLVNNLLDERAKHIKALQDQISLQEEKLDEDRKNIDQLVQNRIKDHFLKDNPSTRPAASDAPANSSQGQLPADGALTSPEQTQP